MSESAQRASPASRNSAALQRRAPQAARPASELAQPSPLAALQSGAGNYAFSLAALGTGVPLPPHVREEMEVRFGADFENVRVHDDTRAHASAAGLDAKAYTHGHDIVFSTNRFAPQAAPGKRLLAHELAHVVQQRRGGARPALDSNAPHEHAADAAADAVAGGQATVSVAGGTGVGVARDEEEGWSAKLRRKYRETKESIPPEYREKMQQAADFAADKAVTAVALPFGPAAAYAADGLGSSLLHGAQKSVAGEEGAADDLKNFGRDKVQEGLGAAKGVATQVTEVVDTAMWVGSEYKGLRDKAAEKIGGKEGSAGNTMVKQALNLTARVVPGLQSLPDLANASDAAKSVGLVDPDTKQASITAPMSIKLNEWAKAAEEKLGATPREPEMFTPMEKAELASNLGTQVVLAFTGAEEVKIAMNVVGAMSGLRGVVESIRNEKDWATSSRFWGSLIGMGLSIVGLKHTMAATKITTLVLKYGWVAAAIFPLSQMAADYFYLETHPELPADERKKLEARIKQGWVAAIHVIKDAILHVSQTQGGSSAKKPGGGGDEGAPAKTGGAALDEGGGAKPAAKVGAGDEAVKTPPTAAAVQPNVAAGAIPIASGKGLPQSDASKALTAKLAKQAPEKAGTVTKLPVRKAGETPPSEPVQQKVPVVAEVADKIAVGQTHGADGGGAPSGKPKLSVVGGRGEPTVAALKPPGGSGAPDTGATAPAAPKAIAATGGGAVKAAGAKGGSKSKAPAKVGAKPVAKAGAESDQLPPLNDKGGRGENAEPLVAVRVAGGGAKTKGTYYDEGTTKFNKAAKDPRFAVVPKSEAEGVFGARPAGTDPKTDIQPLVKNGVQVESGGAGGGKASQHKIMARAEMHDDPDVKAATFDKTIGAARSEAQGYKSLIDADEYGIQRPGNASTGGVDAITAHVPGDRKPATVYLNDFTTPRTSKGDKPTHQNWVNELGDAIQDKRFGFGNVETDRAILTAIKDGNVHVRPVRVEFGEKGPTVTAQANTKPVSVPPAIRDAAAELLAKLPPPTTAEPAVAPGPQVRVETSPKQKVRIDEGVTKKLPTPAATEADLQAEAEIDAAFTPVADKKALKVPE